MNQPIVSVIMNCYNSATYLREAIDSVYAQTFQDWEIIFYDNDSSDDSAEIAKSYNKKLRYFKSEKNISLGAARKVAVSYARGQYIAFLDCDDLWLLEKLERQVIAIQQADFSVRQNGLCYTKTMRIDEQGNDLLLYAERAQLVQGNVFTQLILDCFIACSAGLVDKAIYERVGGFDIKYHRVEELDLWLRIAKDYDVVLVDQVLTKIRIHANNQSKNNLVTIEEYQSLLTGYLAHYPDAIKKIEELQFRKVLMRIILSGDNPWICFKHGAYLVVYCFLHSIIVMRFLNKYFSVKNIYLFFKRFWH